MNEGRGTEEDRDCRGDKGSTGAGEPCLVRGGGTHGPHSPAVGKVSYSNCLFITGAFPAFPFVRVSAPYQPMDLHILLQEPGGTSPSRSCEACILQLLVVTFFQSATPVWACVGCGVPSQAVNICDYCSAIHLICPVLGVPCLAIPITLRWDSRPPQWGEAEVIKIPETCGEAREISVVWGSEVW